MSEISKLVPENVWSQFDAITQVPRPSKKEAKIIKFLEDFAASHNLEYKKDAVGNVTIMKPASPGKESLPTVVLQSHMDMVCEKRGDVQFDFENEPIRTKIVDGWVMAEGTTLGADCGIGMAAELAVLLDDKIAHPAIEALFTVDEETGLTGAFNLGEGMITGKYLINLDSEDEGEIFIGCAGGIGTVASFSYRKETLPEAYAWFRAEVSGLKGGHSGDNIDDGLGNSNKIMTRLLIAGEKLGLRLADFDGGNLHNAIPREAHAVVGVPAAKADEFKALVASLGAAVKDELQYTDAGVQLTAEECAAPEFVVDADTQHRLLLALEGVPNGVFAMSFAMPGLVETSSNLASVKFKGDEIVVVLSHRSSLESSKNDVALAAESVFALAGAKVTHNEGYPGWAPNPNSELLGVVNASYEKLFGKQPKVRAIHAGLECGLFLKMYPWLDMVSFGPTLRGVHSPDERIEISTVEKFWDLLVDVLAEIK